MAIQIFMPHHTLRPYVQYFAYIEINPLENEDVITMDFFPNGISSLVFNLSEEPTVEDLREGKDIKATFTFVGQFDSFSSYKSRKAKFVILNFTELGAYYLFNVYLSEFRNSKVEICDIFPKSSSLVQQLQDHREDIFSLIQILENWLLHKVSSVCITDFYRYEAIVRYIKMNKGLVSVRQICSDMGISLTSLEDHFKQKLGLTPKMYSRIIRFNNCFKHIELESGEKKSWTEIAYQFNYFDQMHFIRDFKRFFGYTPSQHQLSEWNITKMMLT